MAGRRLGPEESALWRRVTETVQPLKGHKFDFLPAPFVSSAVETRSSSVAGKPGTSASLGQRPPTTLGTDARRKVAPGPGETLDGGWDRRLRRGAIEPDMAIDLHGHTLATAHSALDHALARAVAQGARVLLLVTGKPPREDASGRRRGLIRGSIADWLAGSRFAGRIAAVRGAHPRHGGAGALYIILRRERSG